MAFDNIDYNSISSSLNYRIISFITS